MKIYMDSCCYNRPFDDASQDKVRIESEAILTIINKCGLKKWDLVGSDILNEELDNIVNLIKKQKVLKLYSAITSFIDINENIISKAKEIQQLGISPFDALHLATAEYGNVDVFLTTDKKLLNKALDLDLKMIINNPVIWAMEVL